MKRLLLLSIFLSLCVNPLLALEPTDLSYDNDPSSDPGKIIKSLYLSFWGAGSNRITGRVLGLSEKTEINAVVVDIKNEYGQISYVGDVELARKVGAYYNTTIDDIDGFIADLKAQGLYVIGRVVVFKDNQLATRRPRLAVLDEKGKIWKNREKLGWGNPTLQAVHDYNIQIALDAARHGFDEINFDYIRFPTQQGLKYGVRNNQANRLQAINGFLKKAKETLAPTGVKISVDTYGYVCWNKNDTGIGQRLDDLLKYADYICPMLYPSGFHLGIPDYKDPMENIYEVIYFTLQQAYERSGADKRRFRPWLQAFKDYSFDKRPFRANEIREQIDAAEHFGAGGWFLWHPGSYFLAGGLKDALPDNATKVVSTSPDLKPLPEEVLQLKPANNY